MVKTGSQMKLTGTTRGALYLRKLRQSLFCGLSNRGKRYPCLLEERGNDAAFLFQQREEEMLDIHALMATPHGMRRSRLQRFLQLNCHPIHIHAEILSMRMRSFATDYIITGTGKSTGQPPISMAASSRSTQSRRSS